MNTLSTSSLFALVFAVVVGASSVQRDSRVLPVEPAPASIVEATACANANDATPLAMTHRAVGFHVSRTGARRVNTGPDASDNFGSPSQCKGLKRNGATDTRRYGACRNRCSAHGWMRRKPESMVASAKS